jgi:hypothetical protein
MRNILTILFLICFLNILDYFFTLKAVELGFKEGNPIMNIALVNNFFPFIKLILVPIGLFIIWKSAKLNVFISVLLFFTLLVYITVNVYHIYGLMNCCF